MYISSFWSDIFVWGARLIFFIGLIPQIIRNFINNSAKGLSDLLLFSFLNFYFSLFLNSFLRDLPDAYRLVGFMSFLASIILIFQRFFYLKKLDKRQSENLLNVFIINLLFYLFLIPFIKFLPSFVVYVLSIIIFISGVISLIPQIYKTYKDRTIGNLSLQTILIMGLGGVIELSVSIVKILPMDIILVNGANVLCTIIFLSQYCFYKKMNKMIKQKKNREIKRREVFIALIKDCFIFKKIISDF